MTMPLSMSKPLVALTRTLIIAPLSPDTGLSRGGVINSPQLPLPLRIFYTTDPYQSSSHTDDASKLVAPQSGQYCTN